MRFLAIAALALLSASFAQAQGPKVVLDCPDTTFRDLSKIQIQEVRAGEFQIVEFSEKGFVGAVTEKRSVVFGMDAITKNALPELSDWNGYTRVLSRNGVNSYSIDIKDECHASYTTISCTESF